MAPPAAARAPPAALTTEPNSKCKFEFRVFFSSGGAGEGRGEQWLEKDRPGSVDLSCKYYAAGTMGSYGTSQFALSPLSLTTTQVFSDIGIVVLSYFYSLKRNVNSFYLKPLNLINSP